ncbi:uncharacterized protein [Apostichopus japonicus]|uniref:uncharacterized protein isoform X2 n=1 Tax=Stichopus japonicus TaxID=307972 RepID=UPI003AB678E5
MASNGEKNPRDRKSNSERQKQRHDPPVIIYRREPSEPTEREAAAAEADQEPEITLTVESEKHTGFSIEFSDSHSPKMAKKESLSDFVPKSLKERMAESSRLAEERRAIRMSRSKSQEFVKSPRESPTSHKRMKDLWGSANFKNASKLSTDPEPNSYSDLDKRRKSQGETSDSFKENSLPKSKKSAGQSSPAVVTFDNNGDNVSESGTYTIDSDNPSKDVMEARENIEEVFGIAKDETSDADTDKDVSDEEIAEQVVENKIRKKPNGVTGKEKWIEQWASTAAKRGNDEDNHVMHISEGHGISYNIDLSPEPENAKPEKYTSPSRRQQSSPRQNSSPSHAPESPSKGLRSRRLLPPTPGNKKRILDERSPPLSPEPKSEPYMTSSKRVFSFPPVRGLPASDYRNMSKSSTKLSVEDTECLDTEILLKDTETYMHNLEERMKNRKMVPEEKVEVAFRAEPDSDEEELDTSEAFETRSNVEYVTPDPPTTNNNATVTSKKGRTSPSPKQAAGRWSRLSTPNKHKVTTEQEKAPPSKTVETKSSNFERNTFRTSSLPDKKSTTTKKKKEATTVAPVKPKQSVLQPRQTRSTLLRKSRFTGSSGNISDVSPASSMSDLSSSRASVSSVRKKSLPSLSRDKVSCSDSDVTIYTTRKQLKKGQKTAVGKTDTKPGSKEAAIGNRGRSNSAGEHSLKTPPQNNSKKKVKTPSSAGTSRNAVGALNSRNAAGSGNLRNAASSGTSRSTASLVNSRNSSSPSSSLEAYIHSVRERKTENHLSPVSTKSKPKRQTGEKPASKKQVDLQETEKVEPAVSQQTAPSVQSTHIVQNLDHLSKDELIFYLVKTVDDVLGEDVFHLHSGLPPRELKQQFHGRLASRLHRSSSLDLQDEYPKDLTYDRKSSHHRRPGNTAGKRLHGGKPESFDDLVLSSINHLSKKLKDSSEQLLIRLNPTNSQTSCYPGTDYPFLKTDNREIAQILHNLRRMERKLDEIHSVMDEKCGHKSPVSKKSVSPRTWRRTPDLVQSEDCVETSI